MIINVVNNHVEIAIENQDGTYHRTVIAPGADYSNEPQEVQAICKAAHTKSVVDAYKAKQADLEVTEE
jgi:hypothetical protein